MTVGYAIAALVQLAGHRSDAPLSVKAMASGTDLPERYLLQIMKAMKDAGLVESTRGGKGMPATLPPSISLVGTH
jgi:Rrf2 family iron-sulfur cluster assembly transcriptional regulator